MYKVLIDGLVAYKPGSKSYSLLKANLDLETGFAAKFTFTVPPTNPIQPRIKNLSSIVQVFRDDKEIFYGSVRNMTGQDRYKNKSYEALSALSWLSDSVQEQDEFHNKTVRQFLETLIARHNDKVEARKKFEVGTVTVTDSNDSLYRFTNREQTLECIRDKLVDRLGGALRVRHQNDKLILDYVELDEFGKHSTQPIEFGLNLLDYSETLTSDDIITALVPLGAVLEDEKTEGEEAEAAAQLDKRVDIKTVNNGKDYLLNQTAIDNFGYIWQTATWDDVTLPANLKAKGQEYLTSKQFETLTLELKAADLSDLGQDFEAFEEGDLITCKAKPYGMEIVLPVMALSINLLDPAGNSLTLSCEKQVSYTSSNERKRGQASLRLEEVRRIQTSKLKSATDNLTSMMTGSLGGYRITEYDDAGRWLRDLYLNTPDPETATRVLQVNKDGIGGSTAGINGPYTVGMTIDGQILGQQIVAGSVSTEQLSVEYKAEVTKEIKDTTDRKLENYVTLTKLTADLEGVTASATKYTDDSLKNYVTSAALKVETDSIETEVRKKVGASEIISKINQSAEGIKINANKVNIDASTFRVQATKLSWKSTYSEMSESGVLKCSNAELKGTLRAGSSTSYWVELSGSGKLTGGYGSKQYGYIDYSASSRRLDTGAVEHGLQIQGGCLRISCYDISVAATTDTSTTTIVGGTGYMSVVHNMASDMSSCSETSYRFINGLMVSTL